MKKITTFIIACAVLSGSVCFAGNGTSVRNLITRQVGIPEQLMHQKLDEKVNVQFMIDRNGTASVIDVKTNNPELKQYVIRRMSSIDFSAAAEKQPVTYFIDINFKVL